MDHTVAAAMSTVFTPTGTPLGHYTRPTTGARIGLILWAALFLIALLLIIMPPGWNYPATAGPRGGLIGLVELAGICASIGILYCAFALFVIGSYKLDLYEDGIIIEHKGVRKAYPWSAVQECTIRVTKMSINFIPARTQRGIRLRMADGQTYRLDSAVKKMSELVELLPRLTNQPITERTLAQLRAGQSVVFGSITLTPLGLSSGDRNVHWSDVVGLQLDHGIISIFVRPLQSGKERPRTFKQLQFSETPNAWALMGLIAHLSPQIQESFPSAQ